MSSIGVGAVTVTGSFRVGWRNVICLACRLMLPSGLERLAPYLYRGKLTADLMMPSCQQLHFHEKIAFGGSEQAVAQQGLLGSGLRLRMAVGLVLLLVAGEPGTDLALWRFRRLFHSAQYILPASPSLKAPESLSRAFDVLARITAPLTGRSRRWGTPIKTLPGLWSRAAMNAFNFSGRGSSPVLSPWVISPARLFRTSTWLSS